LYFLPEHCNFGVQQITLKVAIHVLLVFLLLARELVSQVVT